jgi:hypothetical protein
MTTANLLRGATLIAQPATGAAPDAATFSAPILDIRTIVTVPITFLDSPATTASTTYKIQMMTGAGTGYLNRRGDSATYTTVSSITAQEISA